MDSQFTEEQIMQLINSQTAAKNLNARESQEKMDTQMAR
jgi:hypothetical protein